MDYGIWPEQRGNRRIFGLSSITQGLDEVYSGSVEQQIYSGLNDLSNLMCSRLFTMDGGEELRISRLLVDANWGPLTSTVYQFCRESTFGNVITPSHGRSVRAADKPWSEYKRKRGERIGPGWRLLPSEQWPIRHVTFDANHWKTFVHQRFKVQFGGRGCLSLYGKNSSGRQLETTHHMDWAEQHCAEFPVKTEGRNRTVYEWQKKASHDDEHGGDCTVGCAVAASIEGISLDEATSFTKKRKPSKSLQELANAAQKRQQNIS